MFVRLGRIGCLALILGGAILPTSATAAPILACPRPFHLHSIVSHDQHHAHHLVGSQTDRNADGWICVKHVGAEGNIHVHIDNNVPH